jgi:membrane protein required for colicin V production
MSGFQIIDWVFVSFTLLMLVHGFVKGFIRELFSWAALVLAIWAGVLLFPAGGAFIRTKTMENVRIVPELLAFLAIFLLVMLLAKLLEHILKEVIDGMHLGTVDKILGAAFGIVEGLALTVLIIFVLLKQPLFSAVKLLEESFIAGFLLDFIKLPPERAQGFLETVFLLHGGTCV